MIIHYALEDFGKTLEQRYWPTVANGTAFFILISRSDRFYFQVVWKKLFSINRLKKILWRFTQTAK